MGFKSPFAHNPDPSEIQNLMSKESYIIPIFQIRKLRLKEVTQRTLTYWLCLLWASHEGPWDGPAPPPVLPNAYF